jgi:hypothetical protein
MDIQYQVFENLLKVTHLSLLVSNIFLKKFKYFFKELSPEHTKVYLFASYLFSVFFKLIRKKAFHAFKLKLQD